MPDHPTSTEIEQFVIGALTGEPLARFETHLAHCATCAARLAREAQLDLALAEIAAATATATPASPISTVLPRRRRRAFAVWGAPAAALAAAAIAVVVLRGGASDERVARGRASVVCADGPRQTACIDDAQRHGLYVQYPSWAGAPPLGQADRGAGPTSEPFVGETP